MSDEETVQEEPSAGFSIGLVWFVLFRRVRLVVAFAVIGILAALAVWFLKSPTFRSTAELMVPYVSQAIAPTPGNPEVMRTSSSGDELIQAEIRVLKSYDLCEQVARSIGPERLAAGFPDAMRLAKASELIGKNLKVEGSPKSIIIEVAFEHSDSTLVQPLLENLIQRYFERHYEIHEPYSGSETNLIQKREEARARLKKADEDLHALKSDAGVISSVEEANKAYNTQINKLRSDLMDSESELALQRELFKDNTQSKPTNDVPVNAEELVPDEVRAEFKRISYELETLRARDFELRNKQFLLDEHPLVKNFQELIIRTEVRKKKLLDEYPQLAAMVVRIANPLSAQSPFLAERDKREALQAKIRVLQAYLSTLQSNAIRLDQLEPSIAEAQRRRDSEEAGLKQLTTALDRKRFHHNSDGAPYSANITVVQAPTPSVKLATKRLKTMGMAFAGSLAFGIGFAFFLEMFVDRTVKRPSEIESSFKLPLLISVPALHDRPVLPSAEPSTSSGDGKQLIPSTGSFVPAWSPLHFLNPYTEALSNRVAMYFEFVKRKPKLVGVTSCSDGAGVSSIAAGLAAALSETGDGRVLIVDMHRGKGAAQTFFQGKPVTGLTELLNGETQNSAAGDNLYAATTSDAGNRTLPTGLKHLLPKLKASDYDYIIFDMPKVSMASMSLRLSALLDLTVLVVESEKVQSDVLKKNCAMLTESGAKVGVVMNKVHTYVPSWLHTEV